MSELLYKSRWWIWLVGTFAWTALLVLPTPFNDPWTFGDVDIDLRFYVSKGIHMGAYATLTAVAGLLAAPVRYRFALIYFLMAHATATEVAQRALEFLGRNGRLYDVGLNHLGIGLGMLLTWRWWSRETLPHQPDA